MSTRAAGDPLAARATFPDTKRDQILKVAAPSLLGEAGLNPLRGA
jgi:hypothetical protein